MYSFDRVKISDLEYCVILKRNLLLQNTYLQKILNNHVHVFMQKNLTASYLSSIQIVHISKQKNLFRHKMMTAYTPTILSYHAFNGDVAHVVSVLAVNDRDAPEGVAEDEHLEAAQVLLDGELVLKVGSVSGGGRA